MFLVHFTLCKIIIELYIILTFILDNQLENAKTTKSILPEFYVRHFYWQSLVYFKLGQI